MKKNIYKVFLAVASLAIMATAAVDQCKPIGWATTSGRTSTAYNVTGGGNASPITVTTFADLQKYMNDDTPRVLYVKGPIGSGWQGRTGDRLEIKYSNKTIIGSNPGTELKATIHITNNAQNIIIRNIVINGPGSNQDQAWDNLNIEGGAKNIWIDHCEFWDGQDGNADVVKGADNVTFTWCIFGYKIKSSHNLSNLIASSDNEPVSEGKLNVTYAFNWWKAATQRKPRCRYGNIHVMNNLFTGDKNIQSGSIMGISAGVKCYVRAENNHFIDEATPIHKRDGGVTESIGDKFTNCTGSKASLGTSFTPPYEYKSYMISAEEVEAVVKANAGATLTSPTQCNSNVTPVSSSSVVASSSSIIASSSSIVASSSSVIASSSSIVASSSSVERPEGFIQIEDGQITGGVLETKNSGFKGPGYVNFDMGGSVVVSVTVEAAGQYELDIYYANGSTGNRSLEISAGNSMALIEFGNTSSWTDWKTEKCKLDLSAGENSIKFATVAENDGPNIDQFSMELLKTTNISDSDNNGSLFTANSQQFHVILNGRNMQFQNKVVSAQVFSIMGLPIKNVQNTNQMNLTDVPSGIYLLKISVDSKTHFQKIKLD